MLDETSNIRIYGGVSISALEKGERTVTATELSKFAQLYRTSSGRILGEVDSTPTVGEALFRATKDLSAADQSQVLRFAEFLAQAGSPALPSTKRNS